MLEGKHNCSLGIAYIHVAVFINSGTEWKKTAHSTIVLKSYNDIVVDLVEEITQRALDLDGLISLESKF